MYECGCSLGCVGVYECVCVWVGGLEREKVCVGGLHCIEREKERNRERGPRARYDVPNRKKYGRRN